MEQNTHLERTCLPNHLRLKLFFGGIQLDIPYLADHPSSKVVNKHGPVWLVSPYLGGCGTPSKWPNSMAYTWGLYANYLQFVGAHPPSTTL